jgi:hypothetical protein
VTSELRYSVGEGPPLIRDWVRGAVCQVSPAWGNVSWIRFDVRGTKDNIFRSK